MASDAYTLPTDKRILGRIIDQHVERELTKLTYRRTLWILAWYYLNGFRRFDVFDPRTARVVPYYLDEEGNMEFQSTELLSIVDKTTARLNMMDLRPKALRQGYSLAGLRERSVAQLVADAVVSDQQLEKVKREFNYLFALLGSAGITGHIVDHPTIGLTSDLEVVHPKELMPFPSLGMDHTKVRGLIRQRVVPMTFLQERFGKAKLEKHKERMDAWSWEWGHDMEEPADSPGNGYILNSASTGALNGVPDGNEMEVVKVRELWMDGPRGTVSRYIVSSGDVVLEDRDLSEVETYCPIGFARFMDNGTFHGAGLFDLMFGIVREMERLMKSLFNNVRDIDKYGVLVMPQGTMNERAVMRDIGKGLRYVSYSKDALLGDDFRPMVIQPFNAGDVPGKVAQFAKSVSDSLSPVQDLLAEKGRVDSASGLQFLDEQISKAMTNPTSGVQAAFGGMYKSLVANASREMLLSDRALPVNRLTLDLAGAVIDPEEGTVNFKKNPIPNFSQISFTVRDTTPKSEVVRKQEAMGLLQAGMTDPEGVKLLALKEGLDFALWMEEEKSAYESVIRNVLLLYGDGTTTQQIVLTPHTTRPDLQLRVLSAFMANPIMSLSSPAVQDAFKAYRESLISFMGQSLPAMVPNPDDVAIVNPQMAGGVAGRIGPQAQPPQGAMNV
jgi:hypothetical protein